MPTKENHRRGSVSRDVCADESSTCVTPTLGKKDSISFFPNSRFINEFAVIIKRIDVDTVDTVEGALNQDPLGRTGFPVEPCAQQPRKGAQQEVTGAASGIDEADAGEAEFVQGGSEGAVQDELLDELRCLQQGKALLRLVGEGPGTGRRGSGCPNPNR